MVSVDCPLTNYSLQYILHVGEVKVSAIISILYIRITLRQFFLSYLHLIQYYFIVAA